MCADTEDEMRVPQTIKWCEVQNWIHAQKILFNQTRISFTYPAGAKRAGTAGALTLSPTHLFMKLTGAGVAVGNTSASVQDCEWL